MSVVFSNFSGGKTNKNGYFRVGNVVLDIPPTDIITDKIVNNERQTTLRGKSEMFTKTGQSRWDVTIVWKAVLDPSTDEWQNVQNILALFKAAPFVEIENSHVRQIFAKNDVLTNASRLAFGLRQMKVDTDPDIVDGLIITLTMTYFNYAPYTLDFGYTQSGSTTVGTDAYKSAAFTDYINKWKAANLKSKDNYFHGQSWEEQLQKEPGKVALNWKRYKAVTAVPKSLDVTSSSSTNTTNVLSPTQTQNEAINPVPAAGAKEVTQANINFIRTLQSNAQTNAFAWLTAVSNQGYSYTITSALRSYQSQKALYGTYVAQGGRDALHKPGGPKYLVAKPGTLNADGSVTGGSEHESGLCLDIVFSNNAAFQYAYQIASQYGWSWPLGENDTVHWKYTGVKTQATPPVQILAKSPTTINGAQTYQDLGKIVDIGPEIQALLNSGWTFDYLTDDTAFFFKPESVILRDNDHGHLDHAEGLFPGQLSVLFVNNLAQIPLANYQYPTYQHIGPAASLISIQLTSLGKQNSDSEEPIHQGLSELTDMVTTLEDQYMQLRTTFRKVSSVQGVQAVFIENAVLNMLGIFGVLPEQVSTSIIPDSSNMVQGAFISHQYENVYEEVDAYKINGITGSYIKGLQSIITPTGLTKSPALNSLTSAEKNQLSEIIQYQNNYNNADGNALGGWLLQAYTSKSNGDFIPLLQNNPTIPLSSAELNAFLTLFISSGGSYPVLQTRASNIIKSKGNITYADYLAISFFNRSSYTPTTAIVDESIANGLTQTPKSNIQSIYIQLLPYISNANQIFASQLMKLVDSPTYKTQIQSSVNGKNPSESNPNHSAYIDFGMGDEIQPSQYFVDHNDQYRALVLQTLGNVAKAVNQTTAQANLAAPNANGPLAVTAKSNTSNVGTSTGIPTDPNQLIKMINIPGYSMKEAFPTFKLFFMEDANSGIYYAFDNFYSYSSVLEMEIIRAWDKPATAVVRMTNISHLFDHKLFDGTTVGKYERSLYTTNPTELGNAATANSVGSAQALNKSFTGVLGGGDLREGFDPANPKLIPMKYFPLQTGTKIQIRFGFDSDPDKLTPVFNGVVTEIEESENNELIITAQSFLIELATVAAESAKDSYWSISGFLSWGKGPAYGGLGTWSDGGDAQSVIRSLLATSQAKHFGHWQINGAAPDQLLKGFNGWKSLTVQLANSLGATNLAPLISNTYDRSGDNIMVNNFVDHTGTTNQGRGTRAFKDQSDQSLSGITGKFDYYIDDSNTMTVWELIKDVSRRYPEYLLLEKFYGFPYEADATMVFGSPLDWYYTRPALIGDDETVRKADDNNNIYQSWWNNGGGKATWSSTYDNYKGLLDPVVIFLRGGETKTQYMQAAGASYSSLQTVDNAVITLADDSGIPFASRTAKIQNMRKDFAAIEKLYLTYLSLKSAPNSEINDGRIKPIRRYHFIDQQTIVHNGIKLNEKMYNAIKITGPNNKSGQIVKANTNIPPNHTRVLDVSDRINDPDKNVLQQTLQNLYGQSFLKEEVGKMYRGELILRGVPEIEPMDILMVLDPSTGIVGPIEVEQVVHSFTKEMGFVSIIKPRCVVVVNELAGASVGRAFMLTMQSVLTKLNGRGITNITVSDQYGGAATFMAGLVLTSAFYYWLDQDFNLNPLVIQPLARFNHPWVGGLEGFQLTGLTGHFSRAFDQLIADEIYPLIDLYKAAHNITSTP